jgi:hypothetical protein
MPADPFAGATVDRLLDLLLDHRLGGHVTELDADGQEVVLGQPRSQDLG